MHKISRLLLLVCFFQAAFFILPAFAEDVPVDLSADTLKYLEDEGQVIAAGSVEVKLEGLIIRADQLVVDVNTNFISAEGNVILATDSYNSRSINLTYDVSTETATMDKFSSVMRPDKIKGELFVKADSIHDYRHMLKGDEGDVTTCDYAKPHYDIRAKKVEYYPDDKVVGFSVTFYENGVPILWMPFFIYPLKDRRNKLPTTGENDVEGFFVKTSWDYFMSPAAYGLFLLDYMEKKGWGYGFDHSYITNEHNDGRLYIYHVLERDTGMSDWVVRLDHTVKLNPESTLKIGHEASQIYLVPSGRRDRTINLLNYTHKSKTRRVGLRFNSLDERRSRLEDYGLNFTHRQGKYSSTYNYSFKRSKDDPHWLRLSHRLNHAQPFLWDSSIRFNLPYYRNTTAEAVNGNERFEPSMELTKKGKLPVLGKYTMKLRENWYVDPDQDLWTGDSGDQYLERQPEINVSLSPWKLPFFTLSRGFSYGYYHEVKYVAVLGRNRDYATGRVGANLVATRNIPIGFGNTIKLKEGVEQYHYNPGDARYQLTEHAGLYSKGWKFFKNQLKFDRRFAEGNTPFFFDQRSSHSSRLTDRMTFYHLRKVTWNINGGYNFLTEKYDPVRTDLTFRPNRAYYTQFRTGWDIENQRHQDLVTRIRYSPNKKFYTTISNSYDLNVGEVKSASSLFDFEIGDNWRNRWHIRFTHTFDYFSKKYEMRDYTIIKDLHCWEAKYTYNYRRREHAFTMTLKALPEEPLGWSTGKGFYYEGYDRAFDRVKSEFYQDSPSRF